MIQLIFRFYYVKFFLIYSFYIPSLTATIFHRSGPFSCPFKNDHKRLETFRGTMNGRKHVKGRKLWPKLVHVTNTKDQLFPNIEISRINENRQYLILDYQNFFED
jgi:hypothetical protein